MADEDLCDFITNVVWEPENDKPGFKPAFDDFTSGPVDSVRIERLSDDMFWMALYKGDARQVVIISSSSGRAKIVARTEAA